jgi:hypothetical protein
MKYCISYIKLLISQLSVMKSTDISWRGRVGRFSNRTLASYLNSRFAKNFQPKISVLKEGWCIPGQRNIAIILMLLLIGGIESNPGPVSNLSNNFEVLMFKFKVF